MNESETNNFSTRFKMRKDIHEVIYKREKILHIYLIGINKIASVILEDGVQITSPIHLKIVHAQAPHEQES